MRGKGLIRTLVAISSHENLLSQQYWGLQMQAQRITSQEQGKHLLQRLWKTLPQQLGWKGSRVEVSPLNCLQKALSIRKGKTPKALCKRTSACFSLFWTWDWALALSSITLRINNFTFCDCRANAFSDFPYEDILLNNRNCCDWANSWII